MPWGAVAGAAISAAGSAASSGKSGGGASGTTQTSTQASDPVIRDYLGRIQSGFDSRNLGNIQVPMSGQTQTALNRITSLADPGSLSSTAASEALSRAREYNAGMWGNSGYGTLDPWARGDFSNSPGYSGLLKTANGSFLPGSTPTVGAPPAGGGGVSVSGSGNPYADRIAQMAADSAQGATNSSFGSAGRYASGANQNALVSNVSDATSKILSPIYESERNRQLQAQGLLGNVQGTAATKLGDVTVQAQSMIPGLIQGQYIDPMMLQGVGNIYDQRNWNDANQDYTVLKNASGLLGGQGGGSTTTQPYFTNPLAGLLGGAAGGAGMFNNLFGGKNSTGIGEDGGWLGRTFFGSPGESASAPGGYQTDAWAMGGYGT